MPSRCAKTGTRASSCTRATRLLPPRGTITSILPSRPRSISPTASRSRIGTSWIASSGKLRDAQPLRQRGMDRARRAMRIRAAAQDRGVAGLQAQRAGIGGDIRAAFVDDADDANRRAHALDGHAVRPLPFVEHVADRIVQLGDDFEAFGHRRDALPVERQAVEEGAGDAGGLGFGDVVLVGGQDFARGARGSPSPSRAAPCPSARRRQRQHMRGLARALADVLHQAGYAEAGSMVFSGAVMSAQCLAELDVMLYHVSHRRASGRRLSGS